LEDKAKQIIFGAIFGVLIQLQAIYFRFSVILSIFALIGMMGIIISNRWKIDERRISGMVGTATVLAIEAVYLILVFFHF